MNKENFLEFIDDKQVTFGYKPRGDEDWYVSIKDLKEFAISKDSEETSK